MSDMSQKKVAIFILTYNSASTITKVLDRIPVSIRELVEEVFIFDDASHDSIDLVVEEWRRLAGFQKLTFVRNKKNRGYGGNQKLGYEYAIKKGYDIVVMLHGDGQYAPELLPEILAPLLSDKAEAVFGSRMMNRGAALAGGMPLYKYIGNKILTKFENWATHANLSEWHSGYRAYSINALEKIPFNLNADYFHFDSEIIIQLLDSGARILEVPIPTYYGDEICYIDGLKYAWNLFKIILQYKAHKIGLCSYPKFATGGSNYELKRSPYSSHTLIERAIKPNSRVLDLGCEPETAKRLINKGCWVTGVNLHTVEIPGIDKFIAHDLEQPLPIPADEKYDYIVLADVLEHLYNANQVLAGAKNHLAENGRMILSTSNPALWFIRLSLLFGKFNYGRRGILDETHVKLYTLNSFLRLIKQNGLRPVEVLGTVIPFELLFSNYANSWLVRAITRSYYGLVMFWKRFFAFQFVIVAENSDLPKPEFIKIEKAV